MERNFNNEFERFLKENADQYRMYPSGKVWSGIYNSLHTRRKWYGLGIILLLITGSLVTVLVTRSPKETGIAANRPVTKENVVTSLSQIIGSTKHVTENKLPSNLISVPGAQSENLAVALTNNFYSTPTNDLASEKSNFNLDEANATKSEPLD